MLHVKSEPVMSLFSERLPREGVSQVLWYIPAWLQGTRQSKTHLVHVAATLREVLCVCQQQTIYLSLKHCAFPHVNFISCWRKNIQRRWVKGDKNLRVRLPGRKEWLGWMKQNLIWGKGLQECLEKPIKPRIWWSVYGRSPELSAESGGIGRRSWGETSTWRGCSVWRYAFVQAGAGEGGGDAGNSPVQLCQPLLTPWLVFHLP